jgi:polar amino acid transport system substrate-binding protein
MELKMNSKISLTLLLAVALAFIAGCEKGREDSSSNSKPEVKEPKHVKVEHGPAGSTLERIQHAKVLRIGVKGDAPPFCFQDKEGNPQGFDVDIGFRLARALGVEPVFVTVKTPERVERLKKGDVDVVIATLTATRRRSKEVDFSLPYFQDQQGLLVKTSTAIQSYRDLGGKKVGAIPNSTSIDNIKVVAPDAHVVSVGSVSEGFEKLNKGEIDALTSDGLTLQALRLGAGDPAQYRLAGEGFSAEPYVIGLPQNDSQFRGKVDEFLTELWNSGAWTRIFNKWLGAQSPYNLEAHFQMPVLPP